MTQHAIDIRGVTKTFGKNAAVSNLDLQVPTGSLCGFLGPNGAGKSTTIRMIMSIILPDAGDIKVLGGSALASKDRIGYLPEERGVYRKMKVGDFLHYMAELKGLKPSDVNKQIDDWLERVELSDVRTQKCEELSKGMQQKIQFVAAVLHEPELLILDEPFSGLDPVNAQLLNRIIRELHDAGTTIIFSTHVLHQAELICERIFLINKGVKLLDATLDEIRARFDPRTVVVEPLNGQVDLQALPHVSDVRAIPNSSEFELELDGNADAQAVMHAVMQRGSLRSVRLRQLSLDEVFIRLVMEDSGAEAAILAREELSHV